MRGWSLLTMKCHHPIPALVGTVVLAVTTLSACAPAEGTSNGTPGAETPPTQPRAVQFTPDRRLDPALAARAPSTFRQRVIVRLAAPDADVERPAHAEGVARRAAHTLRTSRRDALSAAKTGLLERLERGGPDAVEVTHRYPPFNLIALDATVEQIASLASDPEVRWIEADRAERPSLASSLPYIDAPWFQQSRGSGQGTAVAVLDTPIRYDNGHFGACTSLGSAGCAVVVWESFSEQTPQEVIADEDAHDKESHGTNVAGIVHGVAPEATLLGLNVFHWDAAEAGLRSSTTDQIDALAWVADHAEAYGIVAVNMSIGGTPEGPAACNDISRYDAIRTLWADHDVLTVISSGNDGESNAVAPPGCISLAVTVGAHFDTENSDYAGSCTQTNPLPGEIACFSNLNGMVDLIAPGVFIDAGGYVKSGTSMAAPHVAGAVAAWQSWYLQDQGAFKTAFWMHKRLLAQSAAPHIHNDGRRYLRLAMDESIQWDYGHAFPSWYREASANELPSNGSALQQTLEVVGEGWNVSSAYLILDVLHDHPEQLEVTVTGPTGKQAQVTLPGGQANFTGIVGRTFAPGAMASLEGSPVDGTWTLAIRDTQGIGSGNYLQGTLYFVRDGCTTSCEGAGCGDDTCGGDCGAICLIDGKCRADGEVHPHDPCRLCRTSSSVTQWSTAEGAVCDDGDACTEDDRCVAGLCRGDAVTCHPPLACHGEGTCVPETGACVYEPEPDGTPCSDDDACTTGDACSNGLCVGEEVACAAAVACQVLTGCRPNTAECGYEASPDGTACAGGVCKAGSCVPTPGEPDAGDGGVARAHAEGSDAGGCGCTAARSRDGRWLWALAVLGGVAAYRRRRGSS